MDYKNKYLKYKDKYKNLKKLINYGGSSEDDKIPKIIWCYWNTKELPILIKKCVKSIIDNHSDYKVYILNDDNIPDEIFKLKFTKNNATKTSDLVRLWFLKNYGGVWIDISTLLKKPITLYHDYEINCYYFKNESYIESWYIAAKKNSKIIEKWYDELVYANSFNSIEDYISHAKNENEEYINGIDSPGYLWMHVAIRKILINNPELKKNIKLTDACGENGPYKLHSDASWNHDEMKRLVKINNYNYIKLRGIERKMLGEETFIDENEKKLLENYVIDESHIFKN